MTATSAGVESGQGKLILYNGRWCGEKRGVTGDGVVGKRWYRGCDREGKGFWGNRFVFVRGWWRLKKRVWAVL